MNLKEINLDGLTEEQVKFKIFKTVFENTSDDISFDWITDDVYRMLCEKNSLYMAILGNLFKVVSEDYSKIEDDYGIMKCYYPNVLDKMKKLSLELGLDNSLELSNLYTYLLWNGYLSKTKHNVYKIEDRKLIYGMYFVDIIDGIGVCLNHADMLKNFLNRCGYDAALMVNLSDKSAKKDSNISINRNINKSKVRTKILNLILNPIINMVGNHAFTLIKENGRFYVYDSTNLITLEMKKSCVAEVINGDGTFKLNPYFSWLLNSSSDKGLSVIDSLFEMEDLSFPYTREDFICTTEKNMVLFDDNISLLDDFYDDVRTNLISISNG